MDCSTLGFSALHHLPKIAQIHLHWTSDATQPSHPLSPPPLAFNLSQDQSLSQRVESALPIRWLNYWSFSFINIPFNEYSGLISFRIDWFDLLAVQGILKSLSQHHSSKASILQHSAFFMVQLSHPYMTTRKTILLTTQIFVGKVMPLLFNMSRFVIAMLLRSKHLLMLWLQSHPHWFWSPPEWNLTLFPQFPHLFAMKW